MDVALCQTPFEKTTSLCFLGTIPCINGSLTNNVSPPKSKLGSSKPTT
jgi:hypothetical protein